MIKLSYEQQIAFNSLSIIVGNALYALTVVLFLVPSGLITGGATGIALGINRALGLPVSGVLFVINMTMLTVGWVLLGRRFAITTIASTVLSPLFLALWERVFTGFVLTEDLVLNTIFAGLGVGVSLGITIRAGASTGGMDIPPLVLNKYFHIPVSASMLVFDMLILCLQAAFSPLQQCLYGIVMVIVYTVVLDKVLIFGTTRTEVKIISQHADDIREAIFIQLDRGVTVLHGEGGYSHEPEHREQPPAAEAGKAGPCHRPHLLYDREPCDRGERARLLAGKELSGVTGRALRKADFPQGSCKTGMVWGIV